MGGGPSEEEVKSQQERDRAFRQQEEERRLERERQLVAEDQERGRARGQELFGEGSLGTRSLEERKTDIADVLARRKAALSGLTPEEQAAMESQALGGINQATQTQLRQLRGVQGASGVRGGLAAAQQANLLRGGQQAAAEAQRDIFLQNLGARRQALSDFENTVLGEQQRANQERFGQLATEMGIAQLGSGTRGGVRQSILGEQQVESAQQQAAANSGKK